MGNQGHRPDVGFLTPLDTREIKATQADIVDVDSTVVNSIAVAGRKSTVVTPLPL